MNHAPPNVLLIDDDAAVLEMVRETLTEYGMVVHAFSHGQMALSMLSDASAPPVDLVISDINMEGLDGFAVLHRVKSMRPHLPVALMTGQASLEYAVRAMRLGAANLFVKPLALKDMVQGVFHLVGLHREFRLAQVGLRGLISEQRHFRFRSNELEIASLLRHLTDRLVPMGFASDSNLDVIAMAYHETLVNALDHGNLELESSLKGDLLSEEDPYLALRQIRLQDSVYANRFIEVNLSMDPDRFEVTILDEGPGFDTKNMGRPSDSQMAHLTGRGLPLIQMVMDEVHFNEKGNEIKLVLLKKH